MKIQAGRNKGSVLWVALIAIVVAMGITMSMLQTSVSNFKAQDKSTSAITSFFATHGTTELALSDYWMRYNAQTSTGTQNFMTFLNADVNFTLLSSGSGDSIGEDFRLGPASFTMASVTSIPTLDTPTKIYRAIVTKFNNVVMGDRMITQVRLYKKERPKAGTYIVDLLVVAETQKNIGSTASAQSSIQSGMSTGARIEFLQPQWESQLFVFNSPPPFNGFDFAFLTKNLSCTMCHLHVRNRDRIDNQARLLAAQAAGDAVATAAAKSMFGTYDRVKVGVTDNMALRQDSMQSVIEGAFYQRGLLQYENSFANITASDIQSQPVYTAQYNTNSTTVKQDPVTGFVTAQNLHNETTDASGNPVTSPAPGGNCYLAYSTNTANMTDGNLPTSNFPSPISEIPTTITLPTGQVITGPNNKIDPTEVTAAMTGLVSNIDSTQPSTISGGSAVLMTAGLQYLSTSLPSNGVNPGISSSFAGNVILTGTIANPIKIDGKVLINGDVVLRGYVQGTGQIVATGNVYLPGDVIYNNVNVGTINEKFGVNSDSNPLKQANLLGVLAGGNILVGDYLSQATTWSSGSSTQFTPYSVNTSTKQLTSLMGTPDPGKLQNFATDKFLNPETVGGNIPTQTLGTGYKYPDGSSVSTSTQFGGNNWPNLIMQEMAIFNRYELMKVLKRLPSGDPTVAASYAANAGAANPNYDANYIPKFYSLYKYDAVTPANTPAETLLYNGMNYDAGNQHWTGVADPHSYTYFTSVDQLAGIGAVSDAAKFAKNVVNLHPDWISPANMMRIIADESDKRVAVVADPVYGNSSNGYLLNDRRLDGVLYTKNAIFCVERSEGLHYDSATGKWSRVPTLSGGHMQVNGAVIAPDTCVLVNGSGTDDAQINTNAGRKSFIVNYDTRVRSFLGVNNQDFGGFTSWAPRRVAITRRSDFLPPAP